MEDYSAFFDFEKGKKRDKSKKWSKEEKVITGVGLLLLGLKGVLLEKVIFLAAGGYFIADAFFSEDTDNSCETAEEQ